MLLVLKFLALVFPYGMGNQIAAKIIKYFYPFTHAKKLSNLPKLTQLFQDIDVSSKAWDAYTQHIGVSQHQIFYYVQSDQSWLSQCKVDLKGHEYLQQGLCSGQGLLVMTYHHHYNMLFCILLGRFGYPITTIAMDPKESPLYQYFSQLADRMYQNSALHFNSGDFALVKPGSFIRPIIRAFDQQHLVVTANDFPDPFTGNNRIELPFMGAKLTCPTGSVELALRKQIPVVAAYLRWKANNHFELVIEPISAVLPEQKDDETRQIMLQYLTVLEGIVKVDPGLWEGWEWLQMDENQP